RSPSLSLSLSQSLHQALTLTHNTPSHTRQTSHTIVSSLPRVLRACAGVVRVRAAVEATVIGSAKLFLQQAYLRIGQRHAGVAPAADVIDAVREHVLLRHLVLLKARRQMRSDELLCRVARGERVM